MRLDFVIPVYKEELGTLQQTVEELKTVIAATPELQANILIVNDGSPSDFDYSSIQGDNISLFVHPANRGYGAALKTGIRHSDAEWIAITDSDGTYPNKDFPKLLELLDDNDMVIGARTSAVREIPLLRRFPKFLLTKYASYLAKTKIPDLNSGMRIFRRKLALDYWPYFPNGFSFTSTITMGFLAGGYELQYVSIDYFKRTGNSSIRPIKDTLLFFQLVGRMGLYFNPMRVFAPVSVVLFCVGLLKGTQDFLHFDSVGNLSVTLCLASIQIYFMGLLAELVVKKKR